jgi:hypothetical protein
MPQACDRPAVATAAGPAYGPLDGRGPARTTRRHRMREELGLKLGGGVARDVLTGAGRGGRRLCHWQGAARRGACYPGPPQPHCRRYRRRPFQAGGMEPRWASASTPIAERLENKTPAAAKGWDGVRGGLTTKDWLG